VSGKLLTLADQPLGGGLVTLINNKLGLILDTVTQDDGSFKFDNLIITHGINFTIQGKNAKGKSRLKVLMNTINLQPVTPNKNQADVNTDIPKLTNLSLENSKRQETQQEKFGLLSRTQQLREVQIRASKPWTFGNQINESQADEVFRPDARRPCSTLLECLTQNYHTQVRFNQSIDTSEHKCGIIWTAQGYVITIDDVLIATCDYQSILLDDPSDIDKIYIANQSDAIKAKLLSPYLSKFSKVPSVIAIYTRSGNFGKAYNPSVVYYAPKGYDQTKEFYSPKK
jgi:hypothetical protein